MKIYRLEGINDCITINSKLMHIIREQTDVHCISQEIQQYSTYVVESEKEIIGFAVVEPDSCYFGGSIQIHRLCLSWKFDCDELRSSAIYGILDTIAGKEKRLICIDTLGQRDINRHVYQSMGFVDSIMESPKGKGCVVMVAEVEEIRKSKRKNA